VRFCRNNRAKSDRSPARRRALAPAGRVLASRCQPRSSPTAGWSALKTGPRRRFGARPGRAPSPPCVAPSSGRGRAARALRRPSCLG
jgi:hypothetical protein